MVEMRRYDERGKLYEGMDRHDAPAPPPLEPHDMMLCCDLRGVSLDGLDLTRTHFLGCRLNGTTFHSASLHLARFVGCFASPDGPPVDFRGAQWGPTAVMQSHLHALSERPRGDGWRWSPALVEAASGMLSPSNLDRYQAVERADALGDPVVALFLGSLLADPEWEVRASALRALRHLRGRAFPYGDFLLLAWMLLRLGDEHSLVRQEANTLVQEADPPDEMLRVCIGRIMDQGEEGRLAGLRAAVHLARFVDWHDAWLVDLETVHTLLSDPEPQVRVACLDLLEKRGERETMPWVVAALTDPVAAVRVAAFDTLRVNGLPVPATTIRPFLADPDEDVRWEALIALREQGTVEPGDVERGLSDLSPVVRELAQEIAGQAVGQV